MASSRKKSLRVLQLELRGLADEAKASVEFEKFSKGRHCRATFTFDGKTVFNMVSDNPYAIDRAISQAKRSLRGLGCAL